MVNGKGIFANDVSRALIAQLITFLYLINFLWIKIIIDDFKTSKLFSMVNDNREARPIVAT